MGAKKYISDVVKEGKRVRWPKREELIPAIIVVVIVSIFFALILYVEDLAGNKIIDILKDAFAGMGAGGGESASEEAASAVGKVIL